MSAPKVDFNCNECGYLASSETVLKRHITIKHLSKNPPEKLSDSVKDKFLQLSPGSEARWEDTSMLESEVSLQEVSNSTNNMTQHINVKHEVDESFVYPNPSEELECAECGKLFLADHNYARYAYEEHFYAFDCTHCHKHLPGDDLMYCIHMKICPAPCDGNPPMLAQVFDLKKCNGWIVKAFMDLKIIKMIVSVNKSKIQVTVLFKSK